MVGPSLGAGRGRLRALVACTLFGALAVVLTPTEGEAQSCPHGRNCPAGKKDAEGCCPAPTPTGPPTSPTTKPKPLDDAPCPTGKERNADTGKLCCYPGQVAQGSACVGIPRVCPKGYDVDKKGQTCALRGCPEGMERPTNDRTQCCWPGQGWSTQRGQCVGVPKRCPTGYEADGEDCVSNDRDADGVPNASDKCPSDAEDRDGFQDQDGCPDPDNDGDGVLDGADPCPNAAEDRNGYEDQDGCPDEPTRVSDDDGDGVPLGSDKCPKDKEDLDGFQDDDGCPELDDDGDGVADAVDACRREAEDQNGFEDADGCPDEARRLTLEKKSKEREQALAQWEQEKRRKAELRKTGVGLLVGGLLGGGGLAGAFIGLREERIGAVKKGLDTKSQVDGAIEDANGFTGIAIGAGVVGGALTLGGIIALAQSGAPDKPSVALRLGPSSLGLEGRFW